MEVSSRFSIVLLTPFHEITSWSTPVVTEVDGRFQAIISATGASRGYDVETGEEIWRCTGMTSNAIPTPIVPAAPPRLSTIT